MNIYLQKTLNNLLSSVEEHWVMFIKQVPGIILAILIVAIGLLISRQIAKWSKKAITRRTGDVITINFLTKAIKVLFSILFMMYALRVAGLQGIAAAILTAAGASAVIVGFAFRDIGENFISGIILSFSRPFNVNDTVSIGDIFGRVKTIEFRYTKMKTFDGRDVYIPNSDVIKKPVFNYTEDGFFRFDFTVGIAYEDRIGDAEKLIMEVMAGIPDVFTDETHQNFVIADSLAVSTVNLKVHFWVKTFEYGRSALMIKSQVVATVKTALLEAGFTLPADIKEIKLYGTQQTFPVTFNKLE